MNKVPYSQIGSRLIKPYNLYTSHGSVKPYFFANFGEDENSFILFHALVMYSCERNGGEWPDTITSEIISKMEEYVENDIKVSETKLFRDGYILQHGTDYELTHDLIATAWLCCSDGNFLPLSTGHIDFSNCEVNLAKYLEEKGIREPQAVKFLVALFMSTKDRPGVLMDRPVTISKLLEICHENNLIFELCIDWCQKYNLVAIDSENDTAISNGLFFCAYLVSPKLG